MPIDAAPHPPDARRPQAGRGAWQRIVAWLGSRPERPDETHDVPGGDADGPAAVRAVRASRWIALATASALLVLAAAFCLDGAFRPNWDGGMYLNLAESLAAGDGYAYQGVPHGKFPPVYPAALAAALRVGDSLGESAWRPERGLVSAQALNIAAMVATVLLLGSVASRRRRPIAFMVGVAVVSLGWPLVRQVSAVAAEPLYSALQAGALVAACAWGADPGWRREGRLPTRSAIAFALLATAALLTRTVGITVVLGGAAHVWMAGGGPAVPRARRCASIAAIPLVGLAAWFLWAATRPPAPLPAELFETRGYARWFVTPGDDYTARLGAADLWLRTTDLAQRYFAAAVRLTAFESGGAFWPAVAIVSAGLAAAVWRAIPPAIAASRRDARDRPRERVPALQIDASSATRPTSPPAPPDVVALVVLATTAIYLAYTWGGDRFLFPVLPLVAGLGFESIGEGASRLSSRFGVRPSRSAAIGTAVIACAAIWLVPFGVRRWSRSVDETRRITASGGIRIEFVRACAWLRLHAGPDDVIVSDEASSVAWLSERTAWSYPLVRDGDTITAGIRQVGARWILHVEGREWNARPRLPRDFADATRAGTSIVWSDGPARIIRLGD